MSDVPPMPVDRGQSESTGGTLTWAKPIVMRRVADDVADRLVTAVGLGVYVTGQQLPTERELASLLKVSRTSVRDALKQLTESGYLDVRRGRNGGYFVRSDWGPQSAAHVRRELLANWAEFEHVFDARNLIEPLIARTAARRRTSADIAGMEQAVEDYRHAASRDASRRADGHLHLTIARATHNPILVQTSTDLRARVTMNLGAEPYSQEVRTLAIDQHAALVAAIAQGREDEAAQIAFEHFRLSEMLIRQLAERARTQPAEGR